MLASPSASSLFPLLAEQQSLLVLFGQPFELGGGFGCVIAKLFDSGTDGGQRLFKLPQAPVESLKVRQPV